MPFPSVENQLAVIRRGVEKIVPEEELGEKLQKSRESGNPLRVKYGIDPTGIDLHLGHTVPLRKMRQFQELGHQAVIIIGNYTALVGDPSGRDETRPRMTVNQVETNAQDYLEQVAKVIDLQNAEVVRNGDWFGRMSFAEILELTSKVTVAQLLTRDDFSKRLKAESPIYLHECLYPVMQAWDSVVVKADIELGGTEQLYSFMLARDLQRHQGQPGQIGIMSPILVGLDGARRMGKSLGNYIGIAEPAYEMMKKFMQLPDDCMRMYFELLTDVPLEEVDRLLAGHPKEAKLKLAKTIISEYHNFAVAHNTAVRWQLEIGEKAMPAEIPIKELDKDKIPVKEMVFPDYALEGQLYLQAAGLFRQAGLCSSMGEARRLIAQGGAYVGEEKRRVERHDEPINVEDGLLLWAGKKKVRRIKLTAE